MSRSRFNPAGLLGGGLWIALLTPGGTMALAAPGPAAIGTKAAVVDPLDFAGRIATLGDAQGLPFIIVDKVGARAFVFGADGALLGSAPVLLGAARGDDNPPGIGTMRLADIRPEQRITPAGRFEARLGATLGPRDVLWIDYDSALSLHRVVTNKPAERRAQRLASTSPADNRNFLRLHQCSSRFLRKRRPAAVQVRWRDSLHSSGNPSRRRVLLLGCELGSR